MLLVYSSWKRGAECIHGPICSKETAIFNQFYKTVSANTVVLSMRIGCNFVKNNLSKSVETRIQCPEWIFKILCLSVRGLSVLAALLPETVFKTIFLKQQFLQCRQGFYSQCSTGIYIFLMDKTPPCYTSGTLLVVSILGKSTLLCPLQKSCPRDVHVVNGIHLALQKSSLFSVAVPNCLCIIEHGLLQHPSCRLPV